MGINTLNLNEALKAATVARDKAHAPYSRFKVGAAVKVKGHPDLIVGCNVENASFGATICAERVALTQACAQFKKPEIEFVLIATDEAQATVPCALCLQVMAELATNDLVVILANTKGVQRELKLIDLLPHPFRQFTVGGA